jgi:DNA polymerase
MTEAAAMLEELAQQIARCGQCGLCQTRTRTVPGEGPHDARVMFVGEGPGEQEDRSGRPFVGAAGQLLTRLLGEAGLQRESVFIANLVKCRPPANRVPSPDEMAACRPYLDAQIALVRPRFVCLLGRPATQALLSPTAAISRVHGVPEERDGMVYVPLYHPAAALHQASLAATLSADMRRLGDLLRTGL